MGCREKLHCPTEMTTVLNCPAFPGPFSPAIRAAVGLGCVRNFYGDSVNPVGHSVTRGRSALLCSR